MHLLDNGGRLVMGLSSKSLVMGEEGTEFASRLEKGETFENAFFGAAHKVHGDTSIDLGQLTNHRKIYSILYYGPKDGGTLNDTITSPLQDYDRNQINIKKEIVNTKSVLPPQEY